MDRSVNRVRFYVGASQPESHHIYDFFKRDTSGLVEGIAPDVYLLQGVVFIKALCDSAHSGASDTVTLNSQHQ